MCISEQLRQAEEKRIEEVAAKEQAIAARQEIEAELALAKKMINELPTGAGASGLSTVYVLYFLKCFLHLYIKKKIFIICTYIFLYDEQTDFYLRRMIHLQS